MRIQAGLSIVLSLFATATAFAQQWALGPSVGIQNGIGQFRPDLASATLGAISFVTGAEVQYLPKFRFLNREVSLSVGAAAIQRRHRTYPINPFAEPVRNRSDIYLTAYDLEFNFGAAANVVKFRPGRQNRTAFKLDLGLGIAAANFLNADICYRADGQPCTPTTANVFGNNLGGPNLDPYIAPSIYFDSEQRFAKFRFRTGVVGHIHPFTTSEYSLFTRYPNFADAEVADVQRSGARAFVLWVLPQAKLKA